MNVLTTYRIHKAAEAFPLLGDADLKELAEDIKTNGLLDPIVMYQDEILDGRNRLRACELVNVEPRFEEFDGDDPVAYVLSKNLHRRHLTASQRAAIAATLLPQFEEQARARQLSTLKKGGSRPVQEFFPERKDNGHQARDDAAEAMQVNPRYVSDAKRIQQESPEVFERVRSGEMTIPQAKREVNPAPEDASNIREDIAQMRARQVEQAAIGHDPRIETLRDIVDDLESLYSPNWPAGTYSNEIRKGTLVLRRVLRMMENEGNAS